MKKLLCLLLATVLMFALALPAFAAYNDDTVYVTPSGKKYHRQSCPTLANSKTVIAMSRGEAIASGRTACKDCKPDSGSSSSNPAPAPAPNPTPAPTPVPSRVIVPENERVAGFEDVSINKWYAEAVQFAKESGLMNGVGENRFDPEGGVTRAMVVTVLYRLAEEPEVKAEKSPFTDVADPNAWFFNAVIWAADQGVTTGKTENTFAPNEPITREQMATMIIRYALASSGDKDVIEDAMKMDPDGKLVLKMLSEGVPADLAKGFPAAEGFQGYSDADSISSYARWYVLFCRLTGIMKGDAAGTFRPQSTLTRAECAKTFMNLYELGEEFLSAA